MSRAKSGKKRVPAKDAARATDAVRTEVRALVRGPSYMTFDDVVGLLSILDGSGLPTTIDYRNWGLKKYRKLGVLTVDPQVKIRFKLTGLPLGE